MTSPQSASLDVAPTAAQASAPIRRLSTDALAPRERVEAWRDVSYFYRAFRRRYDVLPTDVRAQAGREH